MKAFNTLDNQTVFIGNACGLSVTGNTVRVTHGPNSRATYKVSPATAAALTEFTRSFDVGKKPKLTKLKKEKSPDKLKG